MAHAVKVTCASMARTVSLLSKSATSAFSTSALGVGWQKGSFLGLNGAASSQASFLKAAPLQSIKQSSRTYATPDSSQPVAAVDEPAPELPAEDDAAESPATVKTKALRKQVKHIMNALNLEAAQQLRAERSIPDFRPGDVLAMRVEVPENRRRVSLVRGIVIARRNAGINSTFRIRRILAGVGVEMVFPLFSPNIKEIKVVERRKARRAKLYYLRDKIARLSTVN